MAMRQQLCLMPAVCARCEKEFDITEDLKMRVQEDFEECERQETLCWECRLKERFKKEGSRKRKF